MDERVHGAFGLLPKTCGEFRSTPKREGGAVNSPHLLLKGLA